MVKISPENGSQRKEKDKSPELICAHALRIDVTTIKYDFISNKNSYLSSSNFFESITDRGGNEYLK